MSKTIGECRLNAYNLFFERPLCQCSSNTQKVLIAGNGIQAEEVFKISLIAGQNLGKDLLVDLFSNNAEEFGKKIFEFNTDYIEHSIDVDSDEDEFNINLNTATINKEK